MDKEGNVFVGDSGNNRIQKFALVKPSLIVKTMPPGAEIYLNYADTGHTTPFTFSDMDPMAITLTLKLAGYEEIVSYSAILRKGRTSTIDLALRPAATQVPTTTVHPTPLSAEIIAVSLVSAVICIALSRKRVL